MIFDVQQVFSDQQAVTATAISTNVIQWPAMGTVYGHAAAISRDVGKGNPIPLLVQVTETFATLTSLTITLEHSAAAGLTSPTVLWSSPAIAAASLTSGLILPVTFMPKDVTGAFLGLRYTVGGSNATAGKITAAIVAGVQTNG